MRTNALIDPDRIDRISDAALSSGALQPIETDHILLQDEGLPFIVKWIATSAVNPRHHKPGRSASTNPFESPEAALTLGPLPPHHRLLLNKYPVMDRHLLIVTREYEAQTTPLNAGDFSALAQLMAHNGGLGFYNGGEAAGASQAHKHLQWIPDLPPLAACLPEALITHRDAFDFANAFTPLDDHLWAHDDAGDTLAARYLRLLPITGWQASDNETPPYNLLLTRQWMWLIPRGAEHWEHMSINALGFAGSLFVKNRGRLAALSAAGPMSALRAVTLPSPDHPD